MPGYKRNRIANTSLVIREIWTNGQASRIDIAKRLDLDKSTITSIVSELLDERLVLETETGSPSPLGGRKPVYLRLNASYGHVLGLEIRPDGYKAVAVDIEGRVLRKWTGDRHISVENLKAAFRDIIGEIRSTDATRSPLLGIGVGLSGVVDPSLGTIRYSIPLRITRPLDFLKLAGDGLDVPVFVENDANACAWGELVFHRRRRLRNFIFVLLEIRDVGQLRRFHERTAVGMGVVLEGGVHHGREFSAGEFRSALRSRRSAGQLSLTEAESKRITEDTHVLEKMVGELSRNVALFVNTLNLDAVFLGGDIEQYRDIVLPTLMQEIQSNWAYPNRVRCELRVSSMGPMAVAYGAAGYVLHNVFESHAPVRGLHSIRPQRPVHGAAEIG